MFMHIYKINLRVTLILLMLLLTIIVGLISPTIFAQGTTQNTNPGISLLVTPSPIVETLLPGQTKTIDLKINNRASKTDTFIITSKAFTVTGKQGDIKLDDTVSPQIAAWVSFSDPIFTIKSAEWFTQKVTFSIPENAGFSYSFALVITRKDEPKIQNNEQALNGQVAIFTLINVDKPGATRTMELGSFTTSEKIYEYLPVDMSIALKNTGNTIAQPYGNVFIQRTNKPNTKPIAVLPVNEARGYIIPGSVRVLKTQWNDGFPVYKTTQEASDAKPQTNLTWNWSQLNKLRFGKYYANLVAVYNDGNRDVPIESTISFWVIPWKFMIFATVLIVLLAFGFWTIVKKGINLSKRVKNHVKKPKAD